MKKIQNSIPNTPPNLSIPFSKPKLLPLFFRVDSSATIASLGESRILPDRSSILNGMTIGQLVVTAYPSLEVAASKYPNQMNIFLFLNLSDAYPLNAWDMETNASPSPSTNPSMDMFAPRTVVKKIGQIG